MRSQDVFRMNLRDLMAEHGLKVKDLADMVGLSPSYLSLILSGERQNLSDNHKDAIALALGTTVADLYTPERFRSALSVSPSGAFRPAAHAAGTSQFGPIRRRASDVLLFDEFLRANNIKDDALLSAFYRELNSLSDDEVHRFGQAVHNALVSWQESAARRRVVVLPEGIGGASAASSGSYPSGGCPSGGCPSGKVVDAEEARSCSESCACLDPRVTAEQRRFLGLFASLVSVFGDVPFSMLEAATSWPAARLHQILGPVTSAGAIFAVEDEAGNVALRPSTLLQVSAARNWITPAFKAECLQRLANSIAQWLDCLRDGGSALDAGTNAAPTFGARADQVAELFLEARDYSAARTWYERAAEDAFGQSAWRVAKQYLMVVSSLDGILRTQSEDRVRTYQMLATASINLGEVDEALVYQDKNIAFWERAGRKSDLTMGLLRASYMLSRNRDWAKAKEYLERALKLSSGDLMAEAQSRLGLAAILASTGSLTAAKEELEKTLDIGGTLKEPGIMVQSLLGLSRVLISRGDQRRALTHLNRALSLAERRESVAATWLKIELGRVRFMEGNVDSARSELASALERAQAARNAEQEQMAAAHLARCLAVAPDRKASEEALHLAAGAERFFAGATDRHGRVVALIACAECSAALDDIAGASECFRQAALEARESGDPVLEAFACDAFGKLLGARGDEVAEVMYQRARWARAKIR